jgi:hypothetical protein
VFFDFNQASINNLFVKIKPPFQGFTIGNESSEQFFAGGVIYWHLTLEWHEHRFRSPCNICTFDLPGIHNVKVIASGG